MALEALFELGAIHSTYRLSFGVLLSSFEDYTSLLLRVYINQERSPS
jgi:hypothetical protein